MTTIAMLLAGWCAGWWLLWRVPSLRPTDAGSLTDCAVVIPARNEADNLPGLLASLLTPAVQPAEVVVVDDGSDDGTARVALDHGATVVTSAPRPEGWTGKAWACQQGADATSAARLVFLDADVRLEPEGLVALGAKHDELGGLVSVAPYHRMVRPFERLSFPFNLIAFMGVGAGRPGRHGRSDGAFGPCMACWRADYEEVGGHDAVRSTVTEDLALAQVFHDRGLLTHVFGGRHAVEYRMYPTGAAQLVEGWSKNVATGARFVPALRSLGIALWITALLVATQQAALAFAMPSSGRGLVAAVAYIAFVAQQRALSRSLTNAGWLTAMFFPLTTVVFVAIFLRSAWWTLVRRRVRWRGRDIPVTNGPSSVDVRPEG